MSPEDQVDAGILSKGPGNILSIAMRKQDRRIAFAAALELICQPVHCIIIRFYRVTKIFEIFTQYAGGVVVCKTDDCDSDVQIAVFP